MRLVGGFGAVLLSRVGRQKLWVPSLKPSIRKGRNFHHATVRPGTRARKGREFHHPVRPGPRARRLPGRQSFLPLHPEFGKPSRVESAMLTGHYKVGVWVLTAWGRYLRPMDSMVFRAQGLDAEERSEIWRFIYPDLGPASLVRYEKSPMDA